MKIKCLNSCDPSKVQLDLVETIILLGNIILNNVSIHGQYGECEECDMQMLCRVPKNTNSCLIIDTRYNVDIEVSGELNYKCSWNRGFMQHYQYEWDMSSLCIRFQIKKIATHPYLPIIFFLLGLLILVTGWVIANWLYSKMEGCFEWIKLGRKVEGAIDTFSMDRRIITVDVFRGFCVILMIFVNYGGGRYWFFEPSIWNGLTMADLISPWFLWLCGFSMSISIQKKLIRGVTRVNLLKHVIIRSVIIFTLGLLLNSHSHGADPISKMRIFGVLQRIGLAYFIVGNLEIVLMKRKYKITEACFLEDIQASWPEWLAILSLSILHAVITLFVNVPGCGRGYLGPGGLHNHGQYFNCTGGIAGYIDRTIFKDHVFHESNHKMIYESLDFDAEGLLGTISSAVIVLIGVQAGRVLHLNADLYQRAARWGFFGTFFCLLGGGLCGFSKNNGLIPLNSKLCSISLVYTLSGFAFFIFAILFILIDGKKHWMGFPFHYSGMNPLILYVLHDIFKNAFPFKWEPKYNTHAEHFFMNVLGALVWMSFSVLLHKKKFFLSI